MESLNDKMKPHGEEMTKKEAERVLVESRKKAGELSDEELNSVTGGIEGVLEYTACSNCGNRFYIPVVSKDNNGKTLVGRKCTRCHTVYY